MRTLKITLNGSGFAANYTARTLGMIPHKNGVQLELSGVASGRWESAQKFAQLHGVKHAFRDHGEMLREVQPDLDIVACANAFHGPYVQEAAEAGVKVVVLEKPPVVWPGYAEGRTADAETIRHESMQYLSTVLDTVRKQQTKLLYAEDFVYVDGMKGLVELLIEAQKTGQGKVLYQRGVCAHQGSHAPAYDTPALSGGGALFNKACHPLGPCLYLKQVEGLLRTGQPIRPRWVSALAHQTLKPQPPASGKHFRVMQNVEDFGRITVIFEDKTLAEVIGHDLSISGIRNELSIITDFAQYDMRINPNNENELFLPSPSAAGNLLFREKLPTSAGTSFPRPNQYHTHGYVGEISDAIDCVLDSSRTPQSGPLMAWDTLSVLLAGYQSHAASGAFIDLSPTTSLRTFLPTEMPTPERFGHVFERT